MELKLEELIALALRLSPEDRRQFADLLAQRSVHGVSDAAAAPYSKTPSSKEFGMTAVTVVLPDDLATQARAAGLLAEESMAQLIRRALEERSADNSSTEGDPVRQRRRLVLRNGYLVVEALPGEPPVTDAKVADLLDRMEW